MRIQIAVLLSVLAVAVALAQSTASEQHQQANPSADHDQVQSLDVYQDGRSLHLLLGIQAAGDPATKLWYERSADGGATWSKPVRVDTSDRAPFQLHRGGDAQIAADGKRLVAAWSIAGTGWGDSGPIATAVSRDGGATWQAGPHPADDHSTTGHSFIDLLASAGRFHMVWLDGRGNDKQGLRYAVSPDGGAHWGANATIADNTCECCWNTLRAGPHDRIYTLFRDGSPRDMMLAEASDAGGSWHKIAKVGAFNWDIDACPHAGGALVFGNGTQSAHALVWTGQDQHIGLHYLHSNDDGKTWSGANQLGGKTAKHSDLAVQHGGRVMAVWDEIVGDRSVIYRAASTNDGATWSRARRVSDAAGKATHPRLVATGTGFVALWTEDGKLRTAKFR